jgi:hypothetical protein
LDSNVDRSAIYPARLHAPSELARVDALQIPRRSLPTPGRSLCDDRQGRNLEVAARSLEALAKRIIRALAAHNGVFTNPTTRRSVANAAAGRERFEESILKIWRPMARPTAAGLSSASVIIVIHHGGRFPR